MLALDEGDELARFWAFHGSFSIGDGESALCHSGWMVEHGSKPEEGHCWAMHTRYRMGEMSEAIREGEAAVRIRPGFVEARFMLGALLFETGDAVRAVEEFRACVASWESDPDKKRKNHIIGPYARFRLGRALDAIGDREGARAEFQKVVQHPGLDKFRDWAIRELEHIG
jgi:tetratricopeptide (TPR) repeat protein